MVLRTHSERRLPANGMLMHVQNGAAAGAFSAAPAFDAVRLARRHSGNATAWHDAFELADGRFAALVGEAPGGAAGAAALIRAVRETFGADDPPAGPGRLAALTASYAQSPGLTAIVALIDRDGSSASYVSFGETAPYVRYWDDGVAALPGGVRDDSSSGCGPVEVTVDLRGAALLLLGSRLGAENVDSVKAALTELPLQADWPAAWIVHHLLGERADADAAFVTLRFSALDGEAGSAGTAPRWSASWSFDSAAEVALNARSAFVAALASKANRGRPIDLVAAELIFGEMLGNVVRHAPGPVEITLDWTAELPVLHVLDSGPGFSSRRLRERLPDDDWSESGRGLFIINAMAAAFSVRNRSGRGTHACATLPAAV